MDNALSAGDDAPRLYPPTIRPPPAALSLAAYFLTFISNPLRVMPEAVYREPIVQYGKRLTWVTDPLLVKQVLLDKREDFPKTHIERRALGGLLGKGILIADGRDWRWQRQTTAPTFRHADILQYTAATVAAAEGLVAEWGAAKSGSTHPVDDDMTRVTFRIISETMLKGGDGEHGRGLERCNQAYMAPLAWPLLYSVLRLPGWLPFPGKSRRLRAERDMRETVDRIVRYRRSHLGSRDDILERLMLAKNPDTGEAMSDVQVVDNLLTFLLAGHETTARMLSWTLYLVARSPQWEERILREVISVAGSESIAPAHIEHLSVAAMVLKEAMRLYPPISSLTRVAARNLELGGKKLAAGNLVIIPMFVIHRHRQLWDDPDRFDPTRFTPQQEAARSRYQYLPYGAGPRICIGASFAMVEATAMLATFVRAAHFEVPAGHVPIPKSGVTLRPTGGMPLRIRLRERPNEVAIAPR
jgi:cytochrome P450